MKASIKFRDEQKPLLKAKVPINILSLPFQSSVAAGESKELSLNLSTLFNAGPALKFCYKPNDSHNPFSFVFKTGIGHYGSPVESPFSMSAEFNLINGAQNPSFFIHFKPQIGDFLLKKSHSSSVLVKKNEQKPGGSGQVGENNWVLTDKSMEDGLKSNVFGPGQVGLEKGGKSEVKVNGFGFGSGQDWAEKGLFSGDGKWGLAGNSAAFTAVEGLFSGMEVSARTAMPVRDFAKVNFRWGVRFPPASEEVTMGGSNGKKGLMFPLLVLNKVGIEHVAKNDRKGQGLGSNADVTEACLDVKKQLEVIQAENGLLRKALNELRSDIAEGKMNLWQRDGERKTGMKVSGGSSGGGRVDWRSNGDKKSFEAAEGDTNEGLKKALMGATVS